jgi:DNA-binding transcriptional MocR family regulator
LIRILAYVFFSGRLVIYEAYSFLDIFRVLVFLLLLVITIPTTSDEKDAKECQETAANEFPKHFGCGLLEVPV